MMWRGGRYDAGAVPLTSTALRWVARKPPHAKSRICAWLTGDTAKSKSSMSLASGNLAMVGWYFDRARLLLGDLGGEQVADNARRLVPALDAVGHDLVPRGPACGRPDQAPAARMP